MDAIRKSAVWVQKLTSLKKLSDKSQKFGTSCTKSLKSPTILLKNARISVTGCPIAPIHPPSAKPLDQWLLCEDTNMENVGRTVALVKSLFIETKCSIN